MSKHGNPDAAFSGGISQTRNFTVEQPGAQAAQVVGDAPSMADLNEMAASMSAQETAAPVATKAAAIDASAVFAMLSPAERQSLLAQVANQIAREARGEAATPVTPEVLYPDQNSIDASKIPFNQAVRSAQGWVVSSQTDPRLLPR